METYMWIGCNNFLCENWSFRSAVAEYSVPAEYVDASVYNRIPVSRSNVALWSSNAKTPKNLLLGPWVLFSHFVTWRWEYCFALKRRDPTIYLRSVSTLNKRKCQQVSTWKAINCRTTRNLDWTIQIWRHTGQKLRNCPRPKRENARKFRNVITLIRIIS